MSSFFLNFFYFFSKTLAEEEKKQALSLIREIETPLRKQSEEWK
jgi:hypothetical protein